MKRCVSAVAILSGCLVGFSSMARGQANVDESLETATLYVDSVVGSDSNPGTQALPLKTIGAAAAIAATNNQNGVGTQINIDPGIYRESISMYQGSRNTSLPITFQATPSSTGTVAISGASPFTGWQIYSGNSNIYTNAWPYQWGDCPLDNQTLLIEPEISLRREMVFVNGVPMTQVLSLNEMVEGTFFVDEAGATIYLWPVSGPDPNAADVEVATTAGLFSINGNTNIVLRGLTFEYDNSCRGDNAAVHAYGGANNILVDSDNFVWNNATGLRFDNATSITVQNSIANHNGEAGVASFQGLNLLWQNDQTSYNNWRGAQGVYYNFNGSGSHFAYDHNETINNLTTAFNPTFGIHWDTDHVNMTATGIVAVSNIPSGVFVEKNEGPVSLTNSYLCNNVSWQGGGGGMVVRNSEFVTATGSVFLNNSPSQISVIGQAGGIQITNWQTGQTYNLVTQNTTLTSNTIQGGASQQLFYDSLGGSDWTSFQTTLASNLNTWWNASVGTPFTVPVPNSGSQVDFPTWQVDTGQDASSAFVAPAGDPGAACTLTPDIPDYWLIVDQNYANALLGATTTFTATIYPWNLTGTFQLTSDGLDSIPGASGGWSQSTITDSGSATFTVTTSSTTPPGNYPITLIANSGGMTHTATVTLVVYGTILVEPNTLDFGNQSVGTASPPSSVTVTNTSSTTLTFTSFTFSGLNQRDFTQTNTCGTSLAPGASCTINITFTPGTTGSRSATLSIKDSDTTSPQSISLTGNGIAPSPAMSPTSLSFGNQLKGTSSAPQTVTLSNNGTDTLQLTSITTAGAYSQTNDCGTEVFAGTSCSINVTFTPAQTGTQTSNLTVKDNATPGTQSVSLSGTGVAPSPSVTPGSLSFGTVAYGTTSAAQTATLTNSATATSALTINSITVAGANPTDFVQTNNCGSSLAIGASCTITVTFTPSTIASESATVNISDNGNTGTQTVNLNGTGKTAVSVTPLSLSFGNVAVGKTSTSKSVTLTNSGNALPISSIALTGTNPGDFSIASNTCGSTVAAGASCTVSITFSPTLGGTRSGTLTITDTDPASPQSVSLTGTGTTGFVSLSPTTLTFASQLVGTSSPTQKVTLTNTGTKALTINSITTSGANPGDFSQTNTCGSSVAAGGNCTITVTFTPAAVGSRTASITFNDSDSSSPQYVSLNGTGAGGITVSPGSLGFGNQSVGTSSTPQTITVTNNGTSSLSISSVAVTGANSADFTQTNTCGSSVAAGANCSINVAFSPTASGSRTASLSVTDSDPSSPQNVSLSGTGTAPAVSLSPASLTFSNQAVGTSSAAQTVTLTNTGNASLSLTSVTITGANPGDFSQTNNCGSSIAAGASCTVNVTFTPASSGTRSASLCFTDNAAGSPQTVALGGTGTAPVASLSPTSLAFASQTVGTSSAPQVVTLTNTGNGSLSLTSVTITGANPGDFSQTNNCGSSVAAGASCTVNVTFTPAASGSRSASLCFTDNAAASPQTVALTGTGGESGNVTLSPGILNFGNQSVGTSSAAQSLTLTNGDSSALTITSIAVAGANAADFTETNTCGASLAVNASCSISVTFAPAASGSRSAKISVTDSDPSSPQTASLSGTGTQPVASLSPANLSFGNQNVGVPGPAQTVTITNTGNDTLTLTSISISGANAGDFSDTSTCGTSLAAGASCSAAVTFTPSASGSRSGSLCFADNAPNSPQCVPLSGSGVQSQPSWSPTSINFGNQPVGTTSASVTVTMTNIGTAALNFTSITFTGVNAGDFVQTNNCGSSLAAGASCVVNVNFTPAAAGSRTASLCFNDDAAGSPQNVALSGTGTAPAVSLSPGALTFASQSVGTSSPPQTVTLTNTGNGSLSLTSITFTGSNPADYTQTNTCGTSVAAGGSCTISVTFTPAASGTRTATLNVNDNASGSPQTVSLTGTGSSPSVSLSPTTLSFTAQTVGTTSAAQTVTLTNTGTGSLSLTSITFTGSNPGDFAQTNTCGSAVAAGVSCTISVTFTPAANGTRFATLNVNDNASGSPQTVSLSGTGGTPGVSFSPTSISFPTTTVGVSSTAKTVNLTNTGTVSLNITSIAVTGTNAADFTQTNNCSASLAASASCTISVTFTPSTITSESASLAVTDDAAGSPQSVPLSGTGKTAVTVSPISISFGSVSVGKTSVAKSVTITNSGTTLTFGTISLTGANPGDFAISSNSCGPTLAGGANCIVKITFSPSTGGTRSATLSISDSDPSSPQSVSLSGTGTTSSGVTLSPSSLAFGNQVWGTTSASQTVTLTSSGTATLNLTSITVTGTNASDFTETNTCPSSLAVNATCTITVSFKPSTVSSESATVSITDDAGNSPQSINLTGTGKASITVSPISLNFNTVTIGTTSTAKTVTVTNSGNALTISSVTLTGSKAADYHISSNACTGTLAGGANCTVQVTFSPSVASTETATLNINDGDPSSPQTVSLTGTGSAAPLVTFSPTSLTFASQKVGTSSSPQAVTLSNTGSASLSITSITIGGSNPGDYSQTNNCGSSLAAGASCTINVTFTPTKTGTRSGNVQAADNATGSPQKVTLTGTGS